MALNRHHLVLLIKYSETTEQISKLSATKLNQIHELARAKLVSIDPEDGYINTMSEGEKLITQFEDFMNLEF